MLITRMQIMRDIPMSTTNGTKKDPREQYLPLDILIYLAGLMVFFASMIIIWQEVNAATIKDVSPIKFVKMMEGVSIIDHDIDKLKECQMSNVKYEPIPSKTQVPLSVYIWEYLTDELGLPDVQAAGVFGNMMVECGSRSFDLQPFVYSPGGSYYGLCQWNTYGHHSSINGGTIDEQLGYLADTIESEMGSYQYNRFLVAESPEDASMIFAQWYERCANPYGRQSEAIRAYERFS